MTDTCTSATSKWVRLLLMPGMALLELYPEFTLYFITICAASDSGGMEFNMNKVTIAPVYPANW